MSLELIPITISDALRFGERHHRHWGEPHTYSFAVGCAEGGAVVGVSIVGHPVNRHLQDGWTAEVIRLCTTGQKNACSMLYAASWRAARALGYRRCVTYTLDTEPGTSLVAAGWRVVGEVDGRSWNCRSRPRVDKHPTQDKLRWEVA